jgi:hypothetical protein
MKAHKKITFSLLAFFVILSGSTYAQGPSNASQQPAKKLIEQVAGVWKVTAMNDGKKAITQQVDSTALSSIEFTREAKYIMRTKTQRLDSGLYRLNEEQKTLYLESGVGTDTPPVEWGIDIKGNTLVLSGKATEHAKNYKYTLTRTSMATSKEKKTTNDKKTVKKGA